MNTIKKLFALLCAVCFVIVGLSCVEDTVGSMNFNDIFEELPDGGDTSGNNNGNVIFSEDFEGSSHSFTLVNGSQPNKWYVGTNNGVGRAYIDDNQGAVNTYDVNTPSTVHMYSDITFPASSTPYTLTFRWRVRGEECCDYLSVFLTPTSTTPTAGSQLSSNQIGERYNMGGTTTWNTATISIPAFSSATTRRLVFTWRNDSSVGTQPPAAIDDIVIIGGSGSGNNDPTVPAAPTGVTATATSSDSIIITWNHVTGADGYRVYQATSSTGPFIELVAVTSTSALNYGLPADMTLYYQVEAYNSAGTGPRSSTASATTQASSSITAASIAGTWSNTNDPSETYTFNSDRTGTWYYNNNENPFTFTISGNTVTTTLEYSNNIPPTLTFAADGDSFTDPWGDTFARASDIPAAPTGVTATAIAPDSIRISWTDLGYGYYVYSSPNLSGPFTIVPGADLILEPSNVGGSGPQRRSVIHHNLTANTTYYYRVAAYNNAGRGEYSSIVSATTHDDVADENPFILGENQAWTDSYRWGDLGLFDGLIFNPNGTLFWIQNYECDDDDNCESLDEWHVLDFVGGGILEWSTDGLDPNHVRVTFDGDEFIWRLEDNVLTGRWPGCSVSGNECDDWTFMVTDDVDVIVGEAPLINTRKSAGDNLSRLSSRERVVKKAR